MYKELYLLVDLQEKFKLPEEYQKSVRTYIEKIQNLENVDIITTKWFDNTGNNALLSWVIDLGYITINKTGYGLAENWLQYLKENYSTIHILGADLDTCIYTIAMQLYDRDLDIKVHPNYCNSKEMFKHPFTEALKRNIGKENVIFD